MRLVVSNPTPPQESETCCGEPLCPTCERCVECQSCGRCGRCRSGGCDPQCLCEY